MDSMSKSISNTLGGFAGTTRIDVSNALGNLQRQPETIRTAIFAALFTLTAWLDLSLDHDLSLFALYLIPTLYSAWYLGNKWAYGSCLAGGAVWFVDDWPGWRSYHHAFIPYSNLTARIAVLAIIVAIVSALKNALEDRYEAEQRMVERDLEIAAEVQRRLLPSQPPEFHGVELDFAYRAARKLSGDYYDFIPLSSERMAIAIGDVSGKGLPGALLMASLQSLVRTNLFAREGKLASFARELSQRLYEETADNRFVTLFFAVVDLPELTLHYVNAGHNPPIFCRQLTRASSKSVDVLDKGGPPLGMFPATEYVSGRARLIEGDVLVLYTDGVLDAINPEQQQFGEERLRDVVQASLSLSAEGICQNIVDRLDEFTVGAPQWDDITLAVVKLKPEMAEPFVKRTLALESID